MLAHAQKEFRAAGREEKAKQVASSEELKVAIEKYFHQEERLRMAESGQLGWVEREVEARQWDDQVGQSAWLVHRRCIQVPRMHLYTGVSWCVPPGHIHHVGGYAGVWLVCIQVKKVDQKRRRRDMMRRREQTVRSIPSP